MSDLNCNEKKERTFYLEVLMKNWKGRMFEPCHVNRCTHKKYKCYLNLDVSLFVEKCGKSTNFFVVFKVRSFSITYFGLTYFILTKHPYYVDNWGEYSIPKLTSLFKGFRIAIFYHPTPSHERELALGGKFVK